jgi:regulator of protease activity HflC (stomatin/prohibitin superfamily)
MNLLNRYTLVVAIVAVASLSSCRQYNKPDIQEISPNETAFLIPLTGDREQQVKFDSESFLEQNKIAVGRVSIARTWRKTGYWYLSGEYIPSHVLIKVDRAPVTVQWQSSEDREGNPVRKAGDNAIWIESKDSVGFCVGFNVSAYIKAEDASKFLYMYAGRQLTDVLNTEVNGRVMEVAQDFAAQFPLDKLREQKGEMSKRIQTVVTEFFKERGISITNIGMFGGFTYENPKIQDAIDEVFVAQQIKNTSQAKLDAQDAINERLISEAKAAASAEKEKAEGKAQAFVLEAKGKAESISLEAQALTQAQNNPLFVELRKLETVKEFNSKWDGKLPASYIGSDNVTTLMGIPQPQAK